MKIISGGQTGVDYGALLAAALHDVETGGMAPKGYKTANGANLTLRDEFGLTEHSSDQYHPRTEENVKNSDGTLVIALKSDSPGTKLTFDLLVQHSKPFYGVKLWRDPNNNFDLAVRNVNPFGQPHEVAKWIIENKIQVLNVAGNSEHNCPAIQAFTKQYVSEILTAIERQANVI